MLNLQIRQTVISTHFFCTIRWNGPGRKRARRAAGGPSPGARRPATIVHIMFSGVLSRGSVVTQFQTVGCAAAPGVPRVRLSRYSETLLPQTSLSCHPGRSEAESRGPVPPGTISACGSGPRLSRWSAGVTLRLSEEGFALAPHQIQTEALADTSRSGP